MSDEDGFTEDGVYWQGSRESLHAWIEYKRSKAGAFVRRGYSVDWYPDGYNAMDVYVRHRWYAKPHTPETRALVTFFSEPSQFGIDRGKVSKLAIIQSAPTLHEQLFRKPTEHSRVLFNFDRGPDVDLLHISPIAQRLYDAILAELN